jgi:para-aminobenzoate synthetase/4-amino-4-deoxychorismate lyase
MQKNFHRPAVILEDAREGFEGTRLFRSPRAILRADSADEVEPALNTAESALRAGHHVAGYFAYELGYLFETRLAPLLSARRKLPLLWLGVFERCERLTGAAATLLFSGARRVYCGPLRFDWTEGQYASRFDRLQDFIAAGDLYQANLTFRAKFAFLGDPRALYVELKRYARAGYCAYVDDGERRILSFSPELFFEISPAGSIRTRPMKGTAARGTDPASDAQARIRLVASDKDRAENLMIVDLLRNDLTRIAEPGSVTVENLFEVETYPTVHQLVSTISARCSRTATVKNIVRALFPCGSVTGAPKIRAMEVIRELESGPRGVYCGAIGAFHPDGTAQFNVSIRTLTISGDRGEIGIGGGVVHDSSSCSEYAECLIKARYYTAARVPIELIETLRFEPQGCVFVRETLHLDRMARSAARFGIPFARERARERMAEAIAGAEAPLRVRLVLAETGELSVAVSMLDGVRVTGWRFAVSNLRVNSKDELLSHKTSWREDFERELKRASREFGADEVLFLNEKGQITEGSRTNIFAEVGGKLFTPPLSCGLLGGCLRQELIATSKCTEAVLHPEDLAGAGAVFLGNSLRGLIPALPLKGKRGT